MTVRSGSQNHYKSLTALAPYESLYPIGDDFHTRLPMESDKRVSHHNHPQRCFHRNARFFARNLVIQDDRRRTFGRWPSWARSSSLSRFTACLSLPQVRDRDGPVGKPSACRLHDDNVNIKKQFLFVQI